MPPKTKVPAPAAEPLPDGADGKLVRLGIQREESLMYFIKHGDVWAMPRKTPGTPSKPAFLVASGGIALDMENYLYYVDADGDIARKRRVRE